MKKIFGLLILLLVLTAQVNAQVEVHQITPDTITRKIIMTDTLTEIDTQFIEFKYHSIDSLVAEIVIDSLGMDTLGQWYLAGNNSLKPKRTRLSNNILLGSGTAENWDLSALTASQDYNFYAGYQLRQNVGTTERYNVLFGSGHFNNSTSVDYSTAFGYRNNYTGVSDVDYSLLNGSNNADDATLIQYSFINGYLNAEVADVITYSHINGYRLAAGSAGIGRSFLLGDNNLSANFTGLVTNTFLSGIGNLGNMSPNSGNIDAVFLVGSSNMKYFQGTSSINRSFIVGTLNADHAYGVTESLIAGYQNSRYTINQRSFVLGYQNASSVNLDGATMNSSFISGYRNMYSSTGGATSDVNFSLIQGSSNLINSSGEITSSLINGVQNTDKAGSLTYMLINGDKNLFSATSAMTSSTVSGFENAYNANGLDYSTVLGYRNLYQSTSALSNTIAIGQENGYNAVNHSNSIYLGYRQGYTTGAANKLMIGMAQDDPLIDGSFSSDSLRVNGTLSVRDKTGTAGNIAAFDGDKIVDSGVNASDVGLWELDGTYSLVQKNTPLNNFLFGASVGEGLTTGSDNVIFGTNLNALTTGVQNFSAGFQNYTSATNPLYTFSNGYQNGFNATGSLYSFLNGSRNVNNASNINYSNINGRNNGISSIGTISGSFINGQDNAYTTTGNITKSFINGQENAYNSTFQIVQSFYNGFRNFYNSSSYSYNSFVNGESNLYNSTSAITESLVSGSSNAYNIGIMASSLMIGKANKNIGAGNVRYSTVVGHDNARSALDLRSATILGYQNLYNNTGNLNYTIAIGEQNGYNGLDHSNSIYLGYRQGYTTGAANKLMIGMAQDDPLLSGDFSSDWIRIDGYLEVRDKTGTAGNLAAFDGDKIVDSGISSGSVLTSEVDGSTTNEGLMTLTTTVADQTYAYSSNTVGSDELILTEGTDIALSRVGDTITIASTATGDADQTLTGNQDSIFLSQASGLADTVVVSGFLTSEVDGSVTNELQDLSISGAGDSILITDGTGIDLSGINVSEFTNDTDQTLSWTNTGTTVRDLTISGTGNTVELDGLAAYMDLRDVSTGFYFYEAKDVNGIVLGEGLGINAGNNINITRGGNTLTIESTAGSAQTLSKSGGEVTLSDGGGSVEVHTLVSGSDIAIVDASNSIADIVVGEIDLTLHSGTATQLLGRDGNISAGEIVQTNIGSGLDLTSGTLLVDETELDETDISARACMITGTGTTAETSTTEVILDLGTGFSVEVPSTGAFNIGTDEVDVVQAGYYRVTATMRVNGNDGADIDIRLTRNGTTIITQNMWAGTETTCTLTAVTYISAGQDIDIRADWNSGTSYDVNDIYLTIELIGG